MEMKTLLLNKSEIGSLIDLDRVRDAVEDGYRSFNSGQVVQPNFMHVAWPGTHEGFDFKCGLDMVSELITIKSSSGGYSKNPELGLPRGMNTVLLFDAKTSFLKCVMDGTWITGCRTAAAGAISVKCLARPDASRLAVIGAGNQARQQLRAIARVRGLREVLAWNENRDRLNDYVQEMSAETGLPIQACATAEEAVRAADIIVTTTRGRRGPVVQKEWLRPGTHIAVIGSDMPDKQEISADIFAGAKVVNDSTELCLANGDTHHAVKQGFIRRENIHAEIGEILLGKKPGRETPEEITVFHSVGMAIQDVATAGMLYQGALEKGLGVWYDFRA